MIALMQDIKQPRVTDNGRGTVIVTLDGRQLRGWSYQNDDERVFKMRIAREYVDGWMDSLIHNTKIDLR